MLAYKSIPLRVPIAAVKLRANIRMTKAIPAMKAATAIPIMFRSQWSEHGIQRELPKERPSPGLQTEVIAKYIVCCTVICKHIACQILCCSVVQHEHYCITQFINSIVNEFINKCRFIMSVLVTCRTDPLVLLMNVLINSLRLRLMSVFLTVRTDPAVLLLNVLWLMTRPGPNIPLNLPIVQ
jgi:hypothetical protein